MLLFGSEGVTVQEIAVAGNGLVLAGKAMVCAILKELEKPHRKRGSVRFG
jgi:hypothetical protein